MSTIRTASMRGRGGSTPNRVGRSAILDAAPEFPLGRNEQVLIERVGMGLDLNPLAAAGDDRKGRTSCCCDPHIMLQLRHVFFRRRFFRERPRQHELSLEDRAAGRNAPVKGCRHPVQRRLPDMPLNIGDDLSGLGLVPAAVQLLGGNSGRWTARLRDKSSGSTSARFPATVPSGEFLNQADQL